MCKENIIKSHHYAAALSELNLRTDRSKTFSEATAARGASQVYNITEKRYLTCRKAIRFKFSRDNPQNMFVFSSAPELVPHPAVVVVEEGSSILHSLEGHIIILVARKEAHIRKKKRQKRPIHNSNNQPSERKRDNVALIRCVSGCTGGFGWLRVHKSEKDDTGYERLKVAKTRLPRRKTKTRRAESPIRYLPLNLRQKCPFSSPVSPIS